MIKYEHLIGLAFDERDQHCFTLVRRFYMDNFGIELTDYANPHEWWAHGQNLFIDNAEKEGFRLLDCSPRDYQIGDVLIMAIQSPVGNHSAVVVDGNRILQHLSGQLSRVTAYGGMFRNTTVAAYRHKAVSLAEGRLEMADAVRQAQELKKASEGTAQEAV